MAKKKHKQNRGKGRKRGRGNENYSKRILSILRKTPDQPLNYKQIAARLEVEDPSGRNQIVKNLARLVGKGQIDQVERGKYKLAGESNYYEGFLDMTTHGNGYVIVEELEQDIFIHRKKLNHALDGDTVKVYVFGAPDNKKPEGEITEVIARKRDTFVGILHLKPTFGFVEVNNPKMYTDIFIPRNRVNRAKDGEVVQVKLVKWPKRNDSPEGEVIKVLGQPGAHETAMQSILAQSGLASDFPEEVEAYAQNLDTEIKPEEIAKRRDMRQTLTFTIDPKDAKDFDDALSFEVLKNGNCQVGIHIADVSHYLTPGSVLDDEAFDRGTSIYLVDRVIPMLPEVLSNMACSLRPHEEKYTFSAVFELDAKAQVVDKWFGRTVICSDARFAYEEAQHLIETKAAAIPEEISITGEAYQAPSNVLKAVLKLDELAKILRSNRMSSGAISFDKVEVKFNLNEDNEPTGLYFKTAQDANKLIEEFMLLANRKVSEFIGKQTPKKTFVYRCHDEPDGEKLVALKNLVKQFGYSLDLKDPSTTSKSLNSLLENVNGKKEQNLVDTLAVRSMSKAYYSTENIGHYGLAFEYYSHFTSPIRRYPDVMVHRLLQHYLDQQKSANAEEYELMCKHCSEAERFATEAERDSIKYMQVKYMQQYKDQVFLGVISGVTDFGVFIEIIENKCEGMVRLRDMFDDQYDFDQEHYAVVGRMSGKRYQLGDEVYVRVKATDLVKRNLDFELLGSKDEFEDETQAERLGNLR